MTSSARYFKEGVGFAIYGQPYNATRQQMRAHALRCLPEEPLLNACVPHALEMIRAQGAIVGWTAAAAQVLQALAHDRPSPALAPFRLEALWQPSAIEPAVTWEPFRAGIEISRLYGDGRDGRRRLCCVITLALACPGIAIPATSMS